MSDRTVLRVLTFFYLLCWWVLGAYPVLFDLIHENIFIKYRFFNAIKIIWLHVNSNDHFYCC